MKNSTAPSLLEMQSWMKSILTDPRGAGPAVMDSGTWINYINADESSSVSRLDIYAEAYFGRILEAFTIDFPVTSFVLGEEQFSKLIAEYLKVHPSREYNLNNVSKHIIPFIHTYSNTTAIRDIVTLERLALESFYAPVEKNFDPGDLAAFTETDWEKVKFTLNSSLKFIESSWPLEELWEKRHMPEELTVKENPETGHYIIERLSYHVNLIKVSKTEFHVLKKISEGFPLSSFDENDFPDPEINISTLFSTWIQKSYFREFYF